MVEAGERCGVGVEPPLAGGLGRMAGPFGVRIRRSASGSAAHARSSSTSSMNGAATASTPSRSATARRSSATP